MVGLALFGKYVIHTVGENITRVTPPRGYSIELGTATSVLVASFLGLPVSSTHCTIGSVVAVGLCNGQGSKSIKWGMIRNIFVSWVLTVPLAGLVSAMIYACLRPLLQGVEVPAGYTLIACNGTAAACLGGLGNATRALRMA